MAPRVKRVTVQVEYIDGSSMRWAQVFVTPDSKAGATLAAVQKLVIDAFARMSGVREITS